MLVFSLSDICEERGIDYKGNDISCAKKTDSWEQCSHQCRRHLLCSHWTYLTEEYPRVDLRKSCCLKKGEIEIKTQEIGVVSGSKECGGQRKSIFNFG